MIELQQFGCFFFVSEEKKNAEFLSAYFDFYEMFDSITQRINRILFALIRMNYLMK